MSAVDPPPAPPQPPASGPTGAVLALVTAVVVAVLVVPLVAALVHGVGSGGGADASAGLAPSASATSTSRAPSPVPTSSASSSTSPPGRSAVCWDGSTARRVSACSEPQGTAGLAYVFPSIADQRCGKATDAGPAGVVLRRVCRARTTGGGRAQVVYFQWSTSADAVAYLRGKGLAPARGRGAAKVQRFVSASATRSRAGAVYADEPFAYIVSLPAGSDARASAGQVVSARPADQVRGAVRR